MAQQRNSAIDIYKFFLSIVIIILHSNYNLCPQGYLAVESFFIISGFYLGLRYKEIHGKSIANILISRILAVYFPYLLMIFIALVYNIFQGNYAILKTIPIYILGLQLIVSKSLGENYIGLIGYLWYISVYIQIVSLLICLMKKFDKISMLMLTSIGVYLGLALIIYDSPSSGLNYTIESFSQPIPIGYVRGLVGISFGYICSNIYCAFKNIIKKDTIYWRLGFTVLETLLFSYTVWIIFHNITINYDYCYIVASGFLIILFSMQRSYIYMILCYIATKKLASYVIQLSSMIYFVHFLIVSIIQDRIDTILLSHLQIIFVFIIVFPASAIIKKINKEVYKLVMQVLPLSAPHRII